MLIDKDIIRQLEFLIMSTLMRTGTEREFNRLSLTYYKETAAQYIHNIPYHSILTIPASTVMNELYRQEILLNGAINFTTAFYIPYAPEIWDKDNGTLDKISAKIEDHIGPIYENLIINVFYNALNELDLLDEYLYEFGMGHNMPHEQFTREQIIEVNKNALHQYIRHEMPREDKSTIGLLKNFANKAVSFSWYKTRKGLKFWWKAQETMKTMHRYASTKDITPQYVGITPNGLGMAVETFEEGEGPNVDNPLLGYF